ncbi:MAG: SRPBCC domain-containing protein [Brachybacterium sp.]|nr:SRPBCC domain-containing protein [Brachybacterium sp.]
MTPTATGVRTADGTFAFTRTLPLPHEEAWAAITDPGRTDRWFGSWSGDPESGSIQVTMNAEEGAPTMPARVIACEPPQRLVLLTGEGDMQWHLTLTVGPGEEPGTSTVTLWQVIEEAETAASVGPGWDFYLDRLVAAETGGDVEAIRFEPDYLPELAEHYRAAFA